MSRKKVVKRNGQQTPSTQEPHGENGRVPLGEASGDYEEAVKRQWRDLMSDVGGLILTAFDADPHRFEEQKVEDRKGSFGVTIVALIGGTAVLLALTPFIGG